MKTTLKKKSLFSSWNVKLALVALMSVALCLAQTAAPLALAKEFGVVEDLYVGRNTSTPYGGIGRYQNLLKYSEDFTQSDWTAVTVTPANNQIAPNGEVNTACLLTNTAANGNLAQSATAADSTQYTLSVWMQSGTSTTAQLELVGNGTDDTATTQACTLTSDWQRFSVSHTTVADANQITATVKNTGADATTIKVWGAQLEQAGYARVYAKTTTTAFSESYGILADGDFVATGNVQLGDASADTVTITGTVVGASPALLVNQTTADTIADFQDNGTSVLFLADGGKVGIGTTTPAQVLDVAGNIALTGTVDGYDISAKGANWDTAYDDRLKWDGGATGLTAATGRTSLGLVIGTDVQAFDAGLTSIAGLTTAADKMIYTTALDTYATATLTSAGRAILDDADNAAQRTTLGLGSLATLSSITNSQVTSGSFSNITGVGTLGSLNVTGNVGIGTTAPVAPLHVSGSTITAASTDDIALSLAQTLNDTVNDAGTQVYTGLKLNLTETNKTGWDTVNLIDLQVGGTSKFKVDDAGAITATSFSGDGTNLTGVASAISDLTDTTITAAASGDYLRHNGTAWVDATIQAGDLPTAIDATKLADGSVTSAEFQYIGGLTSDAQTQINAKSAASDALTGLVQSTAAGTSYITGGNVGIGETTPTAKMHLVGSSTSGDYAMKIYVGTDLAAWVKKK